MERRGWLLVGAGFVLLVALLALWVLVRGEGAPKDASGAQGAASDASGAQGAARVPPALPAAPPGPPQTAEARAAYVPPRAEGAEGAEGADAGPPPPLTALILTFPEGTTDDAMHALYARCGLVEKRRSRLMARVGLAPGADAASAATCLKWAEGVQVTEERDPNPAAPR